MNRIEVMIRLRAAKAYLDAANAIFQDCPKQMTPEQEALLQRMIDGAIDNLASAVANVG